MLKLGLERLRDGLDAARIPDTSEGLDGIDSRAIAKADGSRRSLEPSKSFLAIRLGRFPAWLDDDQRRQLVLNKLYTEGMLVRQPSRTDIFSKLVK